MATDSALIPANNTAISSISHFISQALARARETGDRWGATASNSRAVTISGLKSSGRKSAALARGLGWVSLGLGIVELTAPGVIERVVGARGKHRLLLPAVGVREIISGVGILSTRRPLPLWLWARVVGDLMDLGALIASMRREEPRTARKPAATGGVAAGAALDMRARRVARPRKRAEKPPRSILVNQPLEECRRLWHAFSDSPRFHRDFATLRSVDFETGPVGRGTMIRVSMPTGNVQAEFFVQEALRKFKQVAETGEVATTRGQPAGTRSIIGKAVQQVEQS